LLIAPVTRLVAGTPSDWSPRASGEVSKRRQLFSRAPGLTSRPGLNPAAEVRSRRVPKRKADFLRADEVGPVLAATPPRWRPLLAAAVYSGLRKGELLGLRKNDIDLPNRLIIVNCSYDRETTKGGRAEAIPIAAELMPYLRTAVKASPSDLLFPDLQGKMLSRHTPLEEVLRRALAHAGIVEGWEHVCRKTACGYAELAPDDQLRRCPRHGMKLWPKAKVRQIRFHDLRHTTASLLMMASVNPGAVQRILRHSDPRITTETYGHLQPDYLRSEIDRLRFNTEPANDLSNALQPSAVLSQKLLTTFLQAPRSASSTPSEGGDFREEISEVTSAGWTGLEPAASGVTGPLVRCGAVRPKSQNPLKSPSFASLSLQLAPSDYIRTRMFWSTDRVQNFLASDCEIGLIERPPTPVPCRDATAKGAENGPTVAAYWKRRESGLGGAQHDSRKSTSRLQPRDEGSASSLDQGSGRALARSLSTNRYIHQIWAAPQCHRPS